MTEKEKRMEAMMVLDAQTQCVVKHNDLIQRTRYTLSVTEQKMVLYMISKIKPGDDELKEYVFPIKELCRICGVQAGGENYKNFRASIKELADKSFFIEDKEREHLVRWCDGVSIGKNDGCMYARIDDRLRPYLLELSASFTKYEIGYILAMKSKYSIRMYELLKSYAYIGCVEIELEKLKKSLETSEYKDYNNFKRRVLDVSLEEINKYTDLEIQMESVRLARKVSSIRFEINYKEREAEESAMVARRERLAPKIE